MALVVTLEPTHGGDHRKSPGGMTEGNPLRETGGLSFAAEAALGFPGSPPGATKDTAEEPAVYEIYLPFYCVLAPVAKRCRE